MDFAAARKSVVETWQACRAPQAPDEEALEAAIDRQLDATWALATTPARTPEELAEKVAAYRAARDPHEPIEWVDECVVELGESIKRDLKALNGKR